MCTRFTIASRVAAIEQEFQAEFQYTFEEVYNAHFGMELPVIRGGEENKIVAQRWGLIPYWSKGPNLKFHNINSPARNIVKNPIFRVPVRRRRCLVLANCFFIWVMAKPGEKIPYVVYDGKQRLLSFAGIWDSFEDRDSGECIESFSVITTHADKRLNNYTSQMPVIIPPGRRRKFLRSSAHLNEVMRMLRPTESASLNLYPVSSAVNDFQNNTREVVMPVGQRVYAEYAYVPKVYLKLEGMGSMKDNEDRKPEIKLMI
jgi:putative SOS response-associated peptidase YedK